MKQIDISSLPVMIPKYEPPTTRIDYADSAIPKRYRKKDRNAYKKVRKTYCEYCGKPANKRPHHIYSVGSGGPDLEENQIQLCPSCHTKAHSGEIKKEALFSIVAKRMKMDYADLIEGVKAWCV